eukprot:Ihof_evm29s9 gene=Ihof_evmTU29s9
MIRIELAWRLSDRFQTKDLRTPKEYVGFEIRQKGGGIYVTQTGYIQKFAANPFEKRWKMLMHLVQYLVTTKTPGLVFKEDNLSLKVYVDADFAEESGTSKSTSGMASFLEKWPIDWS